MLCNKTEEEETSISQSVIFKSDIKDEIESPLKLKNALGHLISKQLIPSQSKHDELVLESSASEKLKCFLRKNSTSSSFIKSNKIEIYNTLPNQIGFEEVSSLKDNEGQFLNSICEIDYIGCFMRKIK